MNSTERIANKMKSMLVLAMLAVALLVSPVSSSKSTVNPVGKVLTMISKLQNDIIQEGAEEHKLYTEFAEMCEDRSRELHQESKTNKAKAVELTANIEKSAADSELLKEKISSTAAGIDDADSELKKASDLRKDEAGNFKSEETALLATISTLERAITIVEGGNNGGASLAQVQQDRMQSIAAVFGAMVEASSFNSYDQEKLTALVQTSNHDDLDAEETGAPSAAAYSGQSGGIVETLGGLLEKAQKNLDGVRQAEQKAAFSFDMQKQALEDKGRTLNKELGDAKKSLAASAESKAAAEGQLESTKKDLAEGKQELSELHHECLDKATGFEEATTSRNEELKALAEAKKIISESTGGATKQSYDLAQVSFVQVASKAKSSAQSVQALHIVRHLALTHHSQALGKLANNVEKAIRLANGGDPFVKVKRMIESMIDQLQQKGESAATKKAYCDKAMGETSMNKENKEDAIEKLNIQIDVMSAESKKLKADVLRIEKELAALIRTQATMDQLRAEEKAAYTKNKPLMEQGLEGIKGALKVLRDYYAKDDGSSLIQSTSSTSSGGAADGIIGMLEVVESDFSKGIAEMTSEEEVSAKEYQAATNENQVAKATKEGDVKGKTANFMSLDKSITDLKTDRTGSQEELVAVEEYFASVKKECATKVDSYEERKTRREEEMEGLREASRTLSEGPSFLQQGMVQSALRGAAVRVHQ